MRGFLLSFSHPSPILLSGLLVLCTHSLLAQRTLPLENIPITLLITPLRLRRLQKPRHVCLSPIKVCP
jgi:hypothetical protein